MDIDAILKALANPVRRQILDWLKEPESHFAHQQHPLEFGVCAGLIDERTGLSQSTVSAHLATLQRAGLVTSQRVGQWIFFKRDEEAIAAFRAHLNNELSGAQHDQTVRTPPGRGAHPPQPRRDGAADPLARRGRRPRAE